jgi:predicted nucleotide-binding protein
LALIDTLKELIQEGENLAPQGGQFGDLLLGGHNSDKQPEYVSWRLQAMYAIGEIGKQASPMLAEIRSDLYGQYFYKDSAYHILGVLKAAIAIVERQEKAPTGAASTLGGGRGKMASQNAVFIVHGHDQALLQQVARFVDKLEIKPVVLFEEAGKGQTIIEKLESNSDVSFALVLLTPDDLGRAAEEDGELHPRARQNVVLELGYFLAKLGRANVAVLYDERVELPSDYRGVEYVPIDKKGAWKLRLAQELKAAGLTFDMNKLANKRFQ